MHLTVVTAVLLSVGILNAVTAQSTTDLAKLLCKELQDVPCGDGGSRVDDDNCAEFFQTPKSFKDAQEHCRSLDSELVSIHTQEELMNAVCLTIRANPAPQSVWIGVQRSGDTFINADGSDVIVGNWYDDQPDNFGGEENCVEMNHKEWGFLNDDNCSDENAFICSKKM